MNNIYPKGTIVKIINGGRFTDGVVEKNVALSPYFIVKPIVNGKVMNINLTLHCNDFTTPLSEYKPEVK